MAPSAVLNITESGQPMMLIASEVKIGLNHEHKTVTSFF